MIGALKTYSAFYYGFTVDNTNKYINFKEGGGELTAEISIGSYTLTQYLLEVASAMNAAGANTYSLSVNRQTRIVTLTSSGSFDLLFGSGSNSGESAASLLGMSASDSLAITSKVGIQGAGYAYFPQFFLQNYQPSILNKKAAFATVSKSASGRVSVQKFGDERFMECNIRYITDIPQPPNGPVQTNVNGVDDTLDFLEYLITKAPVEFMENLNDASVFEKFILERTPTSQDGIGYELNERFDMGLPYYFDTGVLTFRVITE